jgi:hypothetical protein
MKKLCIRTPKRLFAFGCSFTRMHWPTWAEIVAYDLKLEFYNYGNPGAGYQYIFNTIMQADNHYNFTRDDLIMICWSHPLREDIYKGEFEIPWLHLGSVYHYTDIGDTVKYFTDYTGATLRSLAIVKSTVEFLNQRGCQFHMIAMTNIDVDIDHTMNKKTASDLLIANIDVYRQILKSYQPYLDQISASYLQVLYDNNIKIKYSTDMQLINKKYKEGHPFPKEHLDYLQRTFEHSFNSDTVSVVEAKQQVVVDLLQNFNYKNQTFSSFDMEDILRAQPLMIESKYAKFF